MIFIYCIIFYFVGFFAGYNHYKDKISNEREQDLNDIYREYKGENK